MQNSVTDLSKASKLVAPPIALQMLIRESTTHQAFGALLFGVGVPKNWTFTANAKSTRSCYQNSDSKKIYSNQLLESQALSCNQHQY